MASKNFYTGTDAELYTGSAIFALKIAATPAAYGLVAAQATAYTSTNATFSAAYLLAIDPKTRTRSIIAAKNTAKKSLKKMASELAKIIEATPTVTNQQKIDLGLSIRKTPSPIPAPTERPGVDLVSVTARTVKIHVHDSASSSKRGKPAGAVAAWVYSFIGPAYPTNPADWDFQGSTTKNTHEIQFPDSVASGAQVWICVAWINFRQEAGPASVPISTNIQGGGAAMAA